MTVFLQVTETWMMTKNHYRMDLMTALKIKPDILSSDAQPIILFIYTLQLSTPLPVYDIIFVYCTSFH